MSFKAGILNAYDWRNRGDLAIIETQMAWIQAKVPAAEFLIFSAFWRDNQKAFGPDRSFPPPVSIPDSAGKIGGILGPVLGWWSASRGRGRGSAWEEFATCDAYFLCGGGYLYSSQAPLLSRQLWIHAANSLVALGTGKPVMQFPQSWGPLHKRADRWICRKLGERLPRIAARGDISAKLACELGYAKKSLNLPDVVLAMAEVDTLPLQVDLCLEKRGLGIAPIEYGFARECTEEDRNRFLDKLAEIATRYHRETSQPISLFVQVSIPGRDDDAPMAEKLFSRLRTNDVPASLVNGTDPDDYHALIQRQSCFIGCRMHACIFAMVAGVPTIGLAYQPKFSELFRELGLEERCFDISTFDSLAVCNTLLANDFGTSASRESLVAAVKRSSERVLAGLDICWDAAGLGDAI